MEPEIERFTVESIRKKTRLDVYLSAQISEITRGAAQRLISNGSVLVNGQAVKPAFAISKGDEITIDWPEPERAEALPEPIPLHILFEDADLLVVNKPPGLVIHPAAGHATGTLVNGLLYHCGTELSGVGGVARPGIVHRLDKDTSGLLVVAKKEKFRLYFIDLLQSRKVKKNYRALVIGTLRGNLEIDIPIGRDKNNRTKMTCREDGKEAITHVKSIDSYGGYSLLDVEIETGRTHQIRTHLAHKKLPIIGDKTYNTRKIIAKDTPDELKDFIRSFPRQALHAHKIGFKLPESENYVEFESKIPKDFKELIITLEKFNIS